MRKRSTLIAAIAVLATAVIASVAIAAPVGAPVGSPDGNAQAVGSLITPKKLGKKSFVPAALEVTTQLRSTTAANGVPVPTTKVVIDFDKNVKLFTKGVPTCDAGKLQNVSTEIAERACGNAKIGSGKATALLPVGTQVFTVNQTVTAFNGVPQGGKPVVLLHTYGTTPITTALVLVGVVSNLNKEGFGPRLDVTVPLIAGGTGALTDFTAKIDKKYKYKGKPVSYISAKCPNSKKLKTRSLFTFKDGQTSNPTSLQKCTQNPKK